MPSRYYFFVSVSPGAGTSKSFERTRACRSGLQDSIAPDACRIYAFHLSAELVERHGAEHRDPLAEHPERHPDRPLAALAPDPRITFGFELGNGAVVCHPRMKARSERERTSFRPRSIPGVPPKKDTHYFKIGMERFILGVLGRLAFGDPISESQATDRSTFCPMPGGRSQAASDAPH